MIIINIINTHKSFIVCRFVIIIWEKDIDFCKQWWNIGSLWFEAEAPLEMERCR